VGQRGVRERAQVVLATGALLPCHLRVCGCLDLCVQSGESSLPLLRFDEIKEFLSSTIENFVFSCALSHVLSFFENVSSLLLDVNATVVRSWLNERENQFVASMESKKP
jgi:hypothetical protein